MLGFCVQLLDFSDFTYISDPDFGNCYTYNSNGTQSIAGSGKDYGSSCQSSCARIAIF